MSKVSIGWAADQLTGVEVDPAVSVKVLALLEAADADQNDSDLDQVLGLFSELVRGHAIIPVEPDELWVAGTPGDFVVGETVRVQNDAFIGEAGEIHNGRRGRVTAIRSGDIIVSSTDNRDPKLEAVHYPPLVLDRRVR